MLNLRLMSLLLSLLFLFGCATDPYTNETKASNTANYALLGAVGGAIVGHLSSRDQERRDQLRARLIGAGVGAIAGAAVGSYMDEQERELRKKLRDSQVGVIRSGETIILNMPNNISFNVNQATLKPDFFDILESVAIIAKRYPNTIIEIAGHTDNTGAESYNQNLSERRANSVSAYLQGLRLDPRRLSTLGFGENRPIADNSTQQGRALNRRVELTLIPLSQ